MKLLISLFIISSVFASEKLILSVGDLHIQFKNVDGFYINGSCADKKCEAFKKAQSFDKKEVSPDLLSGGKNPASVKCKTMMNGKVVIGKDTQGNQQSLCLFSDDSYLMN
jgi:hypothetical protein